MKYLLALFLVIGCGTKNAPTPIPPTGDVTVYIFGAPPCYYCNKEIVALEQALKAYPNIKVTVYTEFGRTFTERPTPEVSAAWKKVLNSKFGFIEDKWRCVHYKTFFPDGKCAMPAAVVLKNDQAIKLLPAGTSMPVEQIVAALKDLGAN